MCFVDSSCKQKVALDWLYPVWVSQIPGKVFLKEFVDNTETTVDLRNPETEFELDPNNLPEEIQPAGMDFKRRWHLYDEYEFQGHRYYLPMSIPAQARH